MQTVRGATVLVTGAASGMGLMYAKRAASEGARAVVLWDRDEAALQSARESLAGSSSVFTYTVDLLDIDAIRITAKNTLRDCGTPDVLINNAGIVTGNEYFWQTDPVSQNEPTMRINTLAHMHVTRELLPFMIEESRRAKRILNVASAAATLSNPRMSVYAASKWALYGWSDSLRLELEQAGHSHVRVTTFCPSYVSTGMFHGARGMFLTPVMSPERAVSAAWAAMLAGKPVLLSPWAVNIAKVLRGVLPVGLWDRTAAWMGVYRSMADFKGRAEN